MAVTKILARKGRLDVGIRYILNGDKTQEQILTAHLNCDPGRECRQMLETKQVVGKEGGVQYYHMIQSFQPGEVTPEQALEIATAFAQEHLPGYETVIGVHVDKNHIHAHLIFNSVNAGTGEKYHSNARSYYQQIRAISDRLCREHGLSVIMQGSPGKAVSYIEWLRQSRGQPTFRSMLEADLRTAIEDANDLGHFFMLMEHKGWEIHHGSRLGFRLRGRSGSCTLAGRIHCSRRTVSGRRFKAAWTPSRPDAGPPSFPGHCISRSGSIRNIPDLWRCTSITSTCWARLGSVSTRPG
jgi:hypothetical protein